MFTVYKLDSFAGQVVNLALFKNVSNLDELKHLAVSGKLQSSFINAALISDPFQVLIATNQAVNSQLNQAMKTRSVFSEILYNLSPTKNITDSLRTFGISDSSSSLLVVVPGAVDESLKNQLSKVIQGESVPMMELKDLCNEAQVKKIYKINDSELKHSTLLNSVVTRIATKDIIN